MQVNNEVESIVSKYYLYPVFLSVSRSDSRLVVVSQEIDGKRIYSYDECNGCDYGELPNELTCIFTSADHGVAVGMIDPDGAEVGALGVSDGRSIWVATQEPLSNMSLIYCELAEDSPDLVVVCRRDMKTELYLCRLSVGDELSVGHIRLVYSTDDPVEYALLSPEGDTVSFIRDGRPNGKVSLVSLRIAQGEVIEESEREVSERCRLVTVVDGEAGSVLRLFDPGEKGGEVVSLSPFHNGPDGVQSSAGLDDTLDGEADWYPWDADLHRMIFVAWKNARSLVAIHTDGEPLSFVEFPSGVMAPFNLSRTKVTAIFSSVSNTGTILELDIETGNIVDLWKSMVEALSGNSQVPKAVQGRHFYDDFIVGADGDDVHYWRIDQSDDAPECVIVDLHGGPEDVVVASYYEDICSWTDSGAVWYSLNYHGSITFGYQFQQSIYGRATQLEVVDVEKLLEVVTREHGAELPIFLRGWSYGGTLALLSAARLSSAVAGVIAGQPVVDWKGAWLTGREDFRNYIELLMGGGPEETPSQYRNASPAGVVDEIHVPVLILSSPADARIPIEDVREFVSALHGREAITEYLELDGGHSSISSGPRGRAQRFLAERSFVRKVLAGEQGTWGLSAGCVCCE